MKNEILSEVWHNRDEFAKRHNYDINTMVATLQKMEQHPWNAIVDKKKEHLTNRCSRPPKAAAELGR